MKRSMALVWAVLVSFVFAGSVFAVGPGKTVELDGKGAGRVTFSGDAHRAFKCNDCHPALFKMKKGADVMSMKEMNSGKQCGACHNGAKTFGVKEIANCGKCHKR